MDNIGGKNSLKILGLFFLIFALLVFAAVFFTETLKAKITNGVCSLILAGIAFIFYRGSRKYVKRSDES